MTGSTQEFDAIVGSDLDLLVQLRQVDERLLQVDGGGKVSRLDVVADERRQRRDDAVKGVEVLDLFDEDRRQRWRQQDRQVRVRLRLGRQREVEHDGGCGQLDVVTAWDRKVF